MGSPDRSASNRLDVLERPHGRHRAPEAGFAAPPPAPDAAPSHPAGADQRAGELRPPHPSGPITVVGAAPLSSARAEVRDEELRRFLEEAARIRQATAPIAVPAVDVPATARTPRPAQPVASVAPATPSPDPDLVMAHERAIRQFTRPCDVVLPEELRRPTTVQGQLAASPLPAQLAASSAPPAARSRPAPLARPTEPVVAAPLAASGAANPAQASMTEPSQPVSFFERVRREPAPRIRSVPMPRLEGRSMLGRRIH